jgi:hypothetical protein
LPAIPLLSIVGERNWKSQDFLLRADNSGTDARALEINFYLPSEIGGLDKITFSWYYEIVVSDTHTKQKGAIK